MNALPEYSYQTTHVGAFRTENQDAVICRPDLGIYAVADGAGGHCDGRVASQTIMEAIASLPPNLLPEDRLSALRNVLSQAHLNLQTRASRQGSRNAVSTLVALLISGDYFVVLWVGDSRAYLLRDGLLIQLTHDHTLVQQMLDSGSISLAESRYHPQSNIITRAVGSADPQLNLDKRTGTVNAGDRFLLCSDGLLKTMDDDEIAYLMAHEGDVADLMLTTSLRRRPRDNVSAIVVIRP